MKSISGQSSDERGNLGPTAKEHCQNVAEARPTASEDAYVQNEREIPTAQAAGPSKRRPHEARGSAACNACFGAY